MDDGIQIQAMAEPKQEPQPSGGSHSETEQITELPHELNLTNGSGGATTPVQIEEQKQQEEQSIVTLGDPKLLSTFGTGIDDENGTLHARRLSESVDVLAVVASYLGRKNKYKLREVNRDFRDHVVPRSMVSLQFRTMNPYKPFTQTAQSKQTFFANCLGSFIKVSRLVLEDQLILDKEIAKEIGSSMQKQQQFSRRLETLELRNIQFSSVEHATLHGLVPDDANQIIEENVHCFLDEVLFKPELVNLKQLSLIDFQEGDQVMAALNFLVKNCAKDQTFVGSLEILEINGTRIQDESTYALINEIIMELPSVKEIKLIGTSIGENLDMFTECFKRPQITAIDLQLNGLQQNIFCAYFKHIFNFACLQELTLSSNWLEVDGLHQMKDEFRRFKNLKALRLGINKLCLCHQDDRSLSRKLGEILPNFSTIEELDLQENSINDNKFMDIYPALCTLANLKTLNLQNNPISNVGFLKYLQTVVRQCSNGLDVDDPKNKGPNQLKRSSRIKQCQLQSLILNGCLLKDDGFLTILFMYIENPLIFQSLSTISVNANRITFKSLNYFLNFCQSLRNVGGQAARKNNQTAAKSTYCPQPLLIEMKKQFFHGKQLAAYKQAVREKLVECRDWNQLVVRM